MMIAAMVLLQKLFDTDRERDRGEGERVRDMCVRFVHEKLLSHRFTTFS